MAGPGDFLDPSLWPLFLQSAMQRVPQPPADPMLPPGNANPQTAMPGFIGNLMAPNLTSLASGQPDPNQFSSMPLPQYGKVPPMDDPRIGRGISEGAMLAGSMLPAGRMAMGAGAGRMIPEAMQGVPGLPAAPGPAGPTMASILGLTGATASPSAAGDTPVPQFTWDDPNKSRVGRLKEIDKAIETEASRSTKSAPGTQKARIDSLNTEKNKLLDERSADYTAAREQWLTWQEDARKAAAAEKWAKTSFFDIVPGTRGALIAGTWPASYYGGKYMGMRYPLGEAMARGATVGGLKGFLTANGPSDIDRFGLPEGAPAREAARANFSDPKYWAAVGSNAAIDAALGAAGAVMGNSSRRSILPKGPGPLPPPSSPPPMVPTPGPTGGTPIAPQPLMPQQPALPSAPPPGPWFSERSGRWHDPNTGNFVRTPANPPPNPSAPPPMTGGPAMPLSPNAEALRQSLLGPAPPPMMQPASGSVVDQLRSALANYKGPTTGNSIEAAWYQQARRQLRGLGGD
jgi:hypothetical protein